MTPEEAIAVYLAKGGEVTRCKSARPQRHAGVQTLATVQNDGDRDTASAVLLEQLQRDFLNIREQTQAPDRDADWWAAYEIGPCDPFRPVAEAAALLVITREEGLESARLYKLNLCTDPR